MVLWEIVIARAESEGVALVTSLNYLVEKSKPVIVMSTINTY
jgi:hypothetical protein